MTDLVEITLTLTADDCQQKPSQLLASHAQLPQSKVKEAMQKGAVWLIRGKQRKRLRRASKALKVGDTLELNYNPKLLNQEPPEPRLIHDAQDYSIWFKPYGLNCQGSRWGDFATINRWVELNLPKLTDGRERPVFLVHRLDRATSGLMLLCHSKKAAQLFSEMFKQGQMDKRYQAIVQGDFSGVPQNYEVNEPVDGKEAASLFSYVSQEADRSLVNVKLLTGRKHQIRQHLSGLGYPIIGDRLYGRAEPNEIDLQLQSVSLSFTCPLTHKPQLFEVAEALRLTLAF